MIKFFQNIRRKLMSETPPDRSRWASRLSKYLLYAMGYYFCFNILSCHTSELLFQKNAKSWRSYGEATWYFSNNEIVGQANDQAGFLMTTKSYKDFILELEFMPDSTINSGVFIRCKNQNINANDCHELNIWDLHPNQDFRTGAIVMKSPPLAHVETLGRWNRYRIQTEDGRVQVWVNDQLTSDSVFEELLEGYIGLQAMGNGEIKFRRVKIKHLNAD